MADALDVVDRLLEGTYWVVDFLPVQVPACSSGRYGDVERYVLSSGRAARAKFGLMLRLMCYVDLKVRVADADTWLRPAPQEFARMVERSYLTVLCGQALIVSDPDDTYLTVFNPSERLLDLLRKLATAEGLFVWQPPQS